MNLYYKNTPALWQDDTSWSGFEWIEPNNKDHSIISYKRIDKKGREVIVVLNFTPVRRDGYLIGATKGTYEEIFNSDDEKYGGTGVLNGGAIKSTGIPWNGKEDSIRINVPPFGATVFALKRRAPKKK